MNAGRWARPKLCARRHQRKRPRRLPAAYSGHSAPRTRRLLATKLLLLGQRQPAGGNEPLLRCMHAAQLADGTPALRRARRAPFMNMRDPHAWLLLSVSQSLATQLALSRKEKAAFNRGGRCLWQQFFKRAPPTVPLPRGATFAPSELRQADAAVASGTAGREPTSSNEFDWSLPPTGTCRRAGGCAPPALSVR